MSQLLENGFSPIQLNLSEAWQKFTLKKRYEDLERLLSEDLRTQGEISTLIHKVFKQLDLPGSPEIEHMLALRQGPEDEEFEGIWHDDSSRHFAISLSLTPEAHQIEGGQLEIRSFAHKDKVISISGSREFGQACVFLTGKYGFEHRTRRVTSGNRLVLVLWVTANQSSE